jgi:hypothetical protein
MKPILLHIGSTKTGTSSLQQYFTQHDRDLASQGVVYPIAGRNAGGQIAHHNLCYEKQKVRIELGVFKPEVGTWSDALAEIDECDGAVGLISSEAFMNCRPHQVPLFREVLAGRDVNVVAYVRRQDRWLQSAWNQQARFGRCGLDFWEFYDRVSKRGRGDYRVMLQPWADAFGTERIFVRNFDALPSGGIVPDFFATFANHVKVAETASDSARRNTKAGIKQLVAVAKVLELCRDRLGPDFELAGSSAIKIAEYFRDRPDEVTSFSVLSYEEACEVQRRFSESNRRLAELSPSFGDSGGFLAPEPTEFAKHRNMIDIDDEFLDESERRFVIRMAREISRVNDEKRSRFRPRFLS